MPYPWAVKVRPDYEQNALGYQRHDYVKAVAKLPSNFGGGFADGVAVGAWGADDSGTHTQMYSYDWTGAIYLHRKGGGLPGLASGWKELTHFKPPGHSNGFGGLAGVVSQIVPQRIGRTAYVLMQEGESGNVSRQLHILRMTGPNPEDMDYFTIENRWKTYYGSFDYPVWQLDTTGAGMSGFVTDHDRAPMMWLQVAGSTMAWIDTPEWRANFGVSVYDGSPHGRVNTGNSYAFKQSRTLGQVVCRLMPPTNRYKAPELWFFVTTNVRTQATGLGYAGFTFNDIDVYRAEWKAGQWAPVDGEIYAETRSQANGLQDGPAPGYLGHLQRINPNRMGFETDWHNDAHKVGTIRAVMSGYSLTSVHIRTVHVDRAPDGTPIVMLNNIYPRFPAGSGTGAAYRLDEKGEFRLMGVVPAAPTLNNEDDYGLYAEGQTTTQAIWLDDRPVWLAKEHLTTMGTLTGIGKADGRGKIWKRGELNRESWLD